MVTIERKQEIVEHIPSSEILQKFSTFFSVFADETRLKILMVLSIQDMLVGEISDTLMINQTTISHQLKALKDIGIVSSQRNGKNITYILQQRSVIPIMEMAIDVGVII